MDLDQLRNVIIEEFTDQWQLNDRGHRIEHFQDVESCGLYLNEKFGLGYDPKLIMLVAFFHDKYSNKQDRKIHHLLSGFWIENSGHPVLEGLTPEEIKLVADACREHRASFEGEYSHEFSDLMASADRGFPSVLDLASMIDRAVLYRLDRGASQEEARVGAIEHLKVKFGSKGYTKYPSIYLRAFGDELKRQQAMVDAL